MVQPIYDVQTSFTALRTSNIKPKKVCRPRKLICLTAPQLCFFTPAKSKEIASSMVDWTTIVNVEWYSVTWPYTMTTPYWSDYVPNSTFYRILRGFNGTVATGVACRQGMITPPDTWSRPFWTCICSTCWD